MNFRPERPSDDLEINLIPLIDVLLVILIFLAATTTFSRYSQLEVMLPRTQADATTAGMINISVSRDGLYAMDGRLLSGNTTQNIVQALQVAAPDSQNAAIIISADANASHEAVIRVMEAARLAGIERLNFATQSSP